MGLLYVIQKMNSTSGGQRGRRGGTRTEGDGLKINVFLIKYTAHHVLVHEDSWPTGIQYYLQIKYNDRTIAVLQMREFLLFINMYSKYWSPQTHTVPAELICSKVLYMYYLFAELRDDSISCCVFICNSLVFDLFIYCTVRSLYSSAIKIIFSTLFLYSFVKS